MTPRFFYLLALAAVLPAQSQGVMPSAVAAPSRAPVPFGVGERLTYDVKFGPVKVGSGYMEVIGTEQVRGRETWHTTFTVTGGTSFYKVNDKMYSWIDTGTHK